MMVEAIDATSTCLNTTTRIENFTLYSWIVALESPCIMNIVAKAHYVWILTNRLI